MWSVCGTAEVVWKPRFLWQWPSAHLHRWVWCLSSRLSMGFRLGEFAGQSSTVTPWSLNQLLVPLAVWAGAKSEAEGSMKSSPLFLQTLGPWFPKCTFIWKEDFGPLSNSPVIFLHSPGKTLLTLTAASVHSLWGSSKCLYQLCLTVFSSLRSSLLLVHLFLPKFFLPVNFAFNMLWYSTLWRATPFSNDPLWLTLFVEGVNNHLLDHCQVSSLPHYCGFKEQEIPRMYTVGWSFIETQM